MIRTVLHAVARALGGVLPALAIWALLSAPAAALDLDAAKRQGLVGETHKGYVAAVSPNPSAEVRALVERINQGRREQYLEIARSNGTSLEAVEEVAGTKLVKRAPPGTPVLDETGRWKTK